MKSFYEYKRDSDDNIALINGNKFLFPEHFHQMIEIFILSKGSCGISYNGQNYSLNEGSIVFFGSYDIHSYLSQSDDLDGRCILLPQEFATRFSERNKNKKVATPVIYDGKFCNEILFLIDNYLKVKQGCVGNACCELILSLIENRLTFTEEKSDGETALVRKILLYVNENYKSDVSLKAISKNLCYSQEHLSRIFNAYIKKSIPKYVNELRFNKVQSLIKSTDANVTDAIYESGFKSIQTYYRVKKELTKKRQP